MWLSLLGISTKYFEGVNICALPRNDKCDCFGHCEVAWKILHSDTAQLDTKWYSHLNPHGQLLYLAHLIANRASLLLSQR